MQDMCDWATSIVIGPGLGISAETSRFVNYILQYAEVPTVIDADALNVMAMQPDILHSLRPNCILTPHLGEMSRLIGVPISNLKMNLPKYAREFSEKYQAILVQKDARTIVSSADGESCYVNTCGNSGMSTGGSGDVLAGISGGLLACGIKPYHAAIYGVLMHAHAGDLAAERYGERAMLARNIIECLK